MTDLVKVTGTRQVTPTGPTTISSPHGSVILDSTSTVAVGDLTVELGALVLGNATIKGQLQVSSLDKTSTQLYINKDNTANVDNPNHIPYDPNNIFDTKDHRTQGALYVPGGVGIEKDLNVGGYIYGRISQANTSLQLIVTATNIDSVFYPTFTDSLIRSGSVLFGDNTGTFSGLTYNPARGLLTTEQLLVSSTTASISTSTGALHVVGGVGIGGDLHVDNIYTKIISSINDSNVQIAPDSGVTEIVGDIRVLGQKPIGTAPVVTNLLYVTVDGDDTNDGRAQDSSRACRTVGGALNSPFYGPGTQIRVSPGHYLEDNPLRMQPYTSIMGSDLRTTFIEPINKTQDLIHVDSGCYLAFMTFINGRSGLLEGPYAAGFNRGAYAVSFPPLSGNDRIDLFHSPYVQNCTNQSGPWLRDGTMFVPSQTVQIPSAVGTGTWVANTTTLIVKVNTGTITQGMYINSGQQNPGFFDARTLMLANKPFLQEQVVTYVNQTYPTFDYSREKCFRDVGILVENVAYDAAFGGNQKAVESGLAYYNGVVNLIAGQETQTTAAINYLNSLTQAIIVNTTCTDLLFNGFLTTAQYPQVRNTVLTGGAVSTSSIASLFNVITTIINSGTNFAPSVYRSTGPDAAFVSAEILMQANRKFIQEDTVNWINNTVKQFPYSKIKCKRDTGLIVDAISLDLLYPTAEHSQSTFAGVQYWNQSTYTGAFSTERNQTLSALNYLNELSGKVVLNVTTATDAILGISRYTTGTQITTIESATADEVALISREFDTITTIIRDGNAGWTDKIIPNGNLTNLLSIKHAVSLLQANKTYLAEEITAFIDFTYPGFNYGGVGGRDKCKRDVGYMLDSISFDMLHGGNKQAVQSGLSYYGISSTTSTIAGEITQTTAAFNRIGAIIPQLLTNNPVSTSIGVTTLQNTSLPTATQSEIDALLVSISTITNIVTNGTSVAATAVPISLTASGNANVNNAYNILNANRAFIIDEIINYIDDLYNPTSFKYNEEKCYRDVGLIVDAVSQDILLGGNQKSVEAGLAYWNLGYNSVTGQVTTTTMAIAHASAVALQVIANTAVTPQTGTITTQVINPFFKYGGDYMPQQAVARNFNIVNNIIQNGVEYAPPTYAGGGIFALTGLNGADVKISPRVTSVSTITTGTYIIGLNTSTIGFGNNSTLYFGNVTTFPVQDADVPSQWAQRGVDPIGSMGGSLVDGAVISDRSPIQSFVYDAYTQVTQGGRGIRITNDGYAQLVSVFTIFCSVGVQTDNGGIASIVNSNANFGDVCLLAKGYGARKFTGTVYNPRLKAYPDSPGPDGFNQYYPSGFWPNNAQVEIFLPDVVDRPHISLVMEVVPPAFVRDVGGNLVPQLNDQGLPGFLNAQPSMATLTTGSITINDIDTTGIAVGNTVYIRDQDGNYGTGTSFTLYADTGTIVTDLGYRSITLSRALTNGGGEVDNATYFNLYFCGNSYYSVMSSDIATNPKPEGINILSTSAGLSVSQVPAHITALQYLNTITNLIIDNQPVTRTSGNTVDQFSDVLISGGVSASTFINLRFMNMTDIIGADDITAANAVVPTNLRTKSGTSPSGSSSAIALITANINFMAEEVAAYVALNNPSLTYDAYKCKRDIVITIQRLIYDLESGGNYNSVMVGLSYWSRSGTHHIVQLGENVRRNDYFPDGATVNFYQRSYMSASGYVFEYVGAGTNYGALPQVGRADPVQGKETVQLDSGKVFFTSTDQNGDFRIGPGLVISQATGVLSGRTFTKSLFANMTPFILAVEGR